ncbi:MAG: hypothetical protein MJ247_01455 [Alphaproteobacteria bacterium]|nr:hypothetical protein [Alphaproteobacteria bacterium]
MNKDKQYTEMQAYNSCVEAAKIRNDQKCDSMQIDEPNMVRLGRGLAAQVFDKNQKANVDLDFFNAEEVLSVVKKSKKDRVVLDHYSENFLQENINAALCDKESPIKDLTLQNGSYSIETKGSKNYHAVEALSLVNCEIVGSIGVNLTCENLKALKFDNCRAAFIDNKEKALGESALNLAENHLLHRFTYKNMSLEKGLSRRAHAEFDWNKLSPSTEYINLSKTDIKECNFDGFLKKLPELKNLKMIELAGCHLQDYDASRLSQALTKSSVQYANLSGNCFSEEGENNFKGLKTEVDTSSYFECSEALISKKLLRSQPLLGKIKSATSKKDLIESGVIFDAASCDAFELITKRTKELNVQLDSSDFASKNADGIQLIDIIAKNRQLDRVFNHKNWKDAVEMQKTWNLVSEENRAPYLEKYGKGVFQRNKNQVMMNAVIGKVKNSKSK